MYKVCVAIIIVNEVKEVNNMHDANTPINLNTMWPALILAASRKDKVTGRTRVLIVSTIIRKGLSHLGAPAGRRWAANAVGELIREDKIKASHSGSPRLNVVNRCLVGLNT